MYKTSFVAGDLSSNTSDALEELGALRFTYDSTNGLRVFKYVQYDNGTANVAGAAAQVVYYVAASYASAKVTPDVSDSDINMVAGCMHAALTDLYYGWMQIQGKDTVNTSGADDIAQYDYIIGTGAADGVCVRMAQDTAPTNKTLGLALADDDNTANTVSATLVVGAF